MNNHTVFILLIILEIFSLSFSQFPANTSISWQIENLPDSVIRPAQLEYKGAFKVPQGSGHESWQYGGSGITYFPEGDSEGPNDGYPGSLFGCANINGQSVGELSIPVPVISPEENLAVLNRATSLQVPVCVVEGTISMDSGPFPNALWTIGYLPPQGDQSIGKLYFGGWLSYTSQEEWSHGACDLTLSSHNPSGMWRLSGLSAFEGTNTTMQIPVEWADKYCPGMVLALGGAVNGGSTAYGVGSGPSIIACAPLSHGNPPAPGTILENKILLRYGVSSDPSYQAVRDRQKRDCWSGGAWVNHGDRSAILFFGSKDAGESYYGFPKTSEGYKVFMNEGGHGLPDSCKWMYMDFDSVYHCLDTNTGQRSWYADFPRACVYFYDPDDLAKVAQGLIPSYGPQYYARLDVSEYMYDQDPQSSFLYGTGYDQANGLLYSFERSIEGDLPIVHVWKIHEASARIDGNDMRKDIAITVSPNPFSASIIIAVQGVGSRSMNIPSDMVVQIFDIAGRRIGIPHDVSTAKHNTPDKIHDARYTWSAANCPNGVYIVRAKIGPRTVNRSIMLIR
ncbi:MAG: hypothetical protein A2487_04790 [Candidatus Raymondbacteria bacterium RifOxyC12_full_50_8]|uniref:Secretion system C-terminal sorting domain-containing protein n=1 Tax=Candidatus Raymondbacteria bacterium RIFOXYD12_FULL_49_13 TaxID=1817890 RepID=A0A1F7F6S4_UNCRA|nr:MAG: hypothetical protein A2350_01265 [Candidatus Raymondbacteria bacterium RifOxyB12_full_50_8]OGJ93109.1 MAG: hypothetical protein A2248_13435 [Candidatus Raymondbacteria bacterium RIFOXYA2_FULL_49_16]OGJ94808.1 MAG: hypothetical protein A2487_04790 [Candidatus Raymondbacteria bacterium RifOxyC12_full_50_8]OGK02206.1 MAG: hypothetical protein A2519_16125 [Candidatus Raymondbacteria bacterium RIFOXYD12_FULL_49_13]OGP45006.1 MAG: hypothetical protein A2324_15765 [Candidatus Raymondbacteria b